MDLIKAMRVIVQVADQGSLAGAARALDLAPAVVTRLVADLEQHLGARLMHRTTRRLTFTEAGEQYLTRARQILADIEEAESLAGDASGEPRGHLRVLVPPALAVHQLAKHLPSFHRQFPQVTVELHSPGPVETLDEAFDITLLHTRGPLDGDFVAHRLARTEVILCASPDYLDRRGRPQHPDELCHHDSMLPPSAAVSRGITFHSGAASPLGAAANGAGESVTVVPARPVLTTTHTDTMYAAALHGLGIAGLPSFLVEDALLEHALERVLPAWRLYSLTLWAAVPSRKHLPVRTRVFLDFLRGLFGDADRDPWLAAAGCETQAWCREAAAAAAAAAALKQAQRSEKPVAVSGPAIGSSSPTSGLSST
jgi:DNA-binding transcriptional LysR family regulator